MTPASLVPACALAGGIYALVAPHGERPFTRNLAFWAGLPVAAALATPKQALVPLVAYLAGHLWFRELRRGSWLGVALWLPLLAVAAPFGVRPGAPAAAALVWLGLTVWALRRAAHRAGRAPRALGPHHEAVADCLARTLYPPLLEQSAYHAGQTDLAASFSRWLGVAPWYQRIGMGLGLEVLDIAPLLVTGRPRHLSGLGDAARAHVLERMETSRLLVLPLLLSLFKTALSLHYYERDEVLAELDCEQGCLERNRPALR